MFAVIKTGGKQYRVAEDQLLRIERIKGEPGQIVQLGEVLVLGGDTPQLGTPTIQGASVAAEVVEQSRGDKVIAFKKRRRKNSRRRRGHRQEFTLLRITEILTDGKSPTKTARPKPERKPKAEPRPEADDDDEAAAAPRAKAGKKPAKGKAAAKPKSGARSGGKGKKR
jgi:large subunit ribosomal protein L21